MRVVHRCWLQLVPYIRPLHPPLPSRLPRLPLSHEFTQQLPQQLLRSHSRIRHVRYVHVGLFLLLVRHHLYLRIMEPVQQPPRHQLPI